MAQTIVGTTQLVKGTENKNWTGAASTSDIVSLKNYSRCAIVINVGAWAAGTAAVTLKQAQDVSATGVKALAFDTMYTNAASVAYPALTSTAVTSNTFDLDTAQARYVIEIKAEDLDVDNAFDCIRVDVASPGANADFYGVDFIMYNPRYADSTMPNPTID